jgi:hypothetical protein
LLTQCVALVRTAWGIYVDIAVRHLTIAAGENANKPEGKWSLNVGLD